MLPGQQAPEMQEENKQKSIFDGLAEQVIDVNNGNEVEESKGNPKNTNMNVVNESMTSEDTE